MLNIPEMTGADVAFGNIGRMPQYETLPEEFRRRHNPYCDLASTWFFTGALASGDSFEIDGKKLIPKEGVDPKKAMRAIRAVLCSFDPKHEHKIAACGYMLSEWFTLAEAKQSAE